MNVTSSTPQFCHRLHVGPNNNLSVPGQPDPSTNSDSAGHLHYFCTVCAELLIQRASPDAVYRCKTCKQFVSLKSIQNALNSKQPAQANGSQNPSPLNLLTNSSDQNESNHLPDLPLPTLVNLTSPNLSDLSDITDLINDDDQISLSNRNR